MRDDSAATLGGRPRTKDYDARITTVDSVLADYASADPGDCDDAGSAESLTSNMRVNNGVRSSNITPSTIAMAIRMK